MSSMNKRQKLSKRTTRLPSAIILKIASFVMPHDRVQMRLAFRVNTQEEMDYVLIGILKQQSILQKQFGGNEQTGVNVIVSYDCRCGIKFTISGFFKQHTGAANNLHLPVDVTSQKSKMVWNIQVFGVWKPLRNPETGMILDAMIPNVSGFKQEDKILWMQSRCLEVISWVSVLWRIAPLCLHASYE
jgi:hypothetical protein